MRPSGGKRIVYHLKHLKVPTLKPKFKRLLEYFQRYIKYPYAAGLMDPDYIVLGGMKCGSTSLHYLLQKHPDVAPSIMKETNYFSSHFSHTLNWYKTNFVSKKTAQKHKERTGRNLITGEASPRYIFDPLSPERMSKLYPNAKLMVVLRNPVDRAFSHYSCPHWSMQSQATQSG